MMQETLLLILTIITFVIVAGIRGVIDKKTKVLDQKLDFLYKEITELKEHLTSASPSEAKPERREVPPQTSLTPRENVTEDIDQSQAEEQAEIPLEESQAAFAYTRPTEEELQETTSSTPTSKTKVLKEPRPTFWQRNPDLEKFIGENLFNKIGIAILVIGMGFFLKYAIDKEWINEIGRAFIGLLCGAALIALAHRLRNTFSAFSSVLIGGGIAILYYTITISFQEYHLINQSIAFVLLILITAFTVLLAIRYDRKELAILAILGGFSSPLMISTGGGSYKVLFTYILLLDTGMLVLAYFKKWNLVTIVSFVATAILFGSWLAGKVIGEPGAPYGGALVFASLFYLVFLAMTVVNNLKARTKFNAAEISLLLANTFLYLGAGLLLLSYIHEGQFRGLFVALMGVLNFVFAYTLYKNGRADKILVYLFIGLVLTFVSLVAPIQLKGHYITLFWASETVLLLWLAEKSELNILRKTAFLVLGLMLISLIMDWQNYYHLGYNLEHRFPILNRAFITSAFAVASIGAFRYLYNKQMQYNATEAVDRQLPHDWGINAQQLQLPLQVLLLFVLYVGLLLELNNQLAFYMPQVQTIANGIYHYLWLTALSFRIKRQTKFMAPILVMIGAFMLLLYPMLYNHEIIAVRMQYLTHQMGIGYFMLHYVLIASFISSLLGVRNQLRLTGFKQGKTYFAWGACILLVYLCSTELDHILVLARFHQAQDLWPIVNESHGVGYAILWGVSSFLLMYFGMLWKSRTVRIISLSLFGITLLKLFLIDLRGLSEGGKIAAFLSLGVLLLVISFMYQRLKVLLLKDEPAPLPASDQEVGPLTTEEDDEDN
ncbi:DUF2339 domain-containing protein [Olivibacter ginsenosidimutans]|uniref:DUF2339 domain-containing protein n=1 Tax=Olivibacter ginsenosidimutans TaxID=1176537 RepID=A0ABP9AS87_9SPHI